MSLVLAGPKAVTCQDIPQAFEILNGLDRFNRHMDSQVPEEQRGADWTPRRNRRYFDVALFHPEELTQPVDALALQEKVAATRKRIIELYKQSMSSVVMAGNIVAPYTPDNVLQDEQSIAQLVSEDDPQIMSAIADRRVGVMTLLKHVVDFAAEHRHPRLASWHLQRLAAPVTSELVIKHRREGQVWPMNEPGIVRREGTRMPAWLDVEVTSWCEERPKDRKPRRKKGSGIDRYMEILADRWRLYPKTTIYRVPRTFRKGIRATIPGFNVGNVISIGHRISDDPLVTGISEMPFYAADCGRTPADADDARLSIFGYPFMASRRGILLRRLGEVEYDSVCRAFPELYGERPDPTQSVQPIELRSISEGEEGLSLEAEAPRIIATHETTDALAPRTSVEKHAAQERLAKLATEFGLEPNSSNAAEDDAATSLPSESEPPTRSS